MMKKKKWEKVVAVAGVVLVALFFVFIRSSAQQGGLFTIEVLLIVVSAAFFVAAGFALFYLRQTKIEMARADIAHKKLKAEISLRKDTVDQLEQVTARLTLATNAGKIGIWEYNVIENKVYWDLEMYRLYEISETVQLDHSIWRSFVHQDDLHRIGNLMKKTVATGSDFDADFRITTGDKEEKYLYTAARAQYNEEGELSLLVGVSWDLTPRKRMEKELVAERRRLSAIIEGTNAGTWEWNVQTGALRVNECWAEMLGYTLAELWPLTVKTFQKFVHPNDYRVLESLLEEHFTGKTEYYEAEFRMRHKNGSWTWVMSRGKVSLWADSGVPQLMYGTHLDISRQKQIESEIRHLADHDALTGLPVLRLAKDRIAMALSSGERNKRISAVCFIDLDGFKKVNDTFGHDGGDALLQEVAQRLVGCLRKVDTVARIGGDEFLVVLSDLKQKEDVERIAQKLVRTVSKPYEIGENNPEVGLSMGIALFQGAWEMDDIGTLISKADEAMYRVKKAGKNGYAFAD